MAVLNEGEMTNLVDPKSFNVIALNNTVMPAEDRNAKVEFQRKVSLLQGLIGEYSRKFSEVRDKMPYIEKAVKISEQPLEDISKMVWGINKSIKEISEKFYGDGVKSRLDIQSYLTPIIKIGGCSLLSKIFYSCTNENAHG